MTGLCTIRGDTGLMYLAPSRGFAIAASRGVGFWHSSTQSSRSVADYVNFPSTVTLTQAIAANWPTVSSDLGAVNPRGEPASQAAGATMDAAVIDSTKGGASSAARIAVGISGGATTLVNYYGYDAATTTGHVANIAALVLILPAINLDFYYQNNTGGLRASIETAWGITYPTALPAHADPQSNLAALSGKPTRIYIAGSDGDAIQTKAMADANLATLGGNGTVIQLSGTTHSEATVGTIDVPDLVSWLKSVAA